MAKNVRLCARDFVSYQKLTQSISHPVNLVADVAFLLTPTEKSSKLDTVNEWINKQRSQAKIIVGVNVNNLIVNKVEDKHTDDLIFAFVQALKQLKQTNDSLTFIFLPHDNRNVLGNLNDNQLSQEIIQQLSPEIQLACFKIPFPCLASEIKAIVKHLDCVVTSRMHLGLKKK